MSHDETNTVPIRLTNTHPGQTVRHFCRCHLLEAGSFLSALLTHNSTAIKDNANRQMSDADIGDQSLPDCPNDVITSLLHQTRSDYLMNEVDRKHLFFH